MKRLPAIRPIPRKAGSLLFLFLFFSHTNTYAQGWIDITPPALPWIYKAQTFDFIDGSFEVFVWNWSGEDSRGFRLTADSGWDSVLVYTSWICDPIYGERETRSLSSLGRSFHDPSTVFSVFVRGGCITECATHVYRDTTGSISIDDWRFGFDDFSCAGVESKIAVSPADENQIFLVFFDSLYSSSNRGETFTVRSAPTPSYFSRHDYLALSPDDPGILFAGGWDNGYQVLKSIDTGMTWTPVLEEPISPIEFVENDPTRLYSASASGVLRSTDLGDTWLNVFPSDSRFVETRKSNPSEVFAGTTSGNLYRSSDAGETWNIYNDSFSDFPVLSIYSMPGCDTLIVTTTTGVFKVFASFVLNADGGQDLPDSRFALHQNYPNPFNPITSIRFEMKEPGMARVSVFDILGREIAILLHEELPRGNHARTWDGANFPSGVYYYRLTTENFSQTKQMVLIK